MFHHRSVSHEGQWRTNEPIQSRGNTRVYCCTISPGLQTSNCTCNKAGLVYRATPSDGRPGDDMLGGAGSQQIHSRISLINGKTVLILLINHLIATFKFYCLLYLWTRSKDELLWECVTNEIAIILAGNVNICELIVLYPRKLKFQ